MVAIQKIQRAPQATEIKELEKGMKRRYAKFVKEHSGRSTDSALHVAQNWAEERIVRTNGKLTISFENEIQKILDGLRQAK